MKIILDTQTNSLEHLIDTVENWDLDFKLLSNGGFQGQLKQFISPDILIGYARFCCHLDQAGAAPAGFRTFVISGSHCQGFWWRGYSVKKNDLLIFPQSNELRSVSGSDFEIFTISIRSLYLEQVSNYLGLPGATDNKHEVIQLDPQNAHILRKLATGLVKSDGGAETITTSRLLAEKLILFSCCRITEKEKPSLRKRDQAIERIIEYVRSTPVPTSELPTLCRIARVSERTLQYAIKERYGIAPYAFVKRWNLNSARQMLLLADPDIDTVNIIAMNHGFHHQGQFAADYYRLFTELPSQTLDT